MGEKFDSYCGLVCEGCEFKESAGCKGCIASNGNPFHGKCEVAECAKSKGKRFCGECESIPCDLLKGYSYDKEHGDNGMRIENCQRIKLSLVAEARKGINPVSCCGHHCDYCFMGQWCGGCRSTYNCCSLATVFDDKKCPNVVCSSERGLEGCYECDDLDDCKKGYYANDMEYIAKASAKFIKKHGSDSYTKALKTAIDNGVKYPRSFDEAGSVENAMNILEKYL